MKYHLLFCFALYSFLLAAQPEQEMLLLRAEITTPVLSPGASFFPGLPAATSEQLPPALHRFTLPSDNFPVRDQPLCYATQDLAFFCRLEVKMEKATRMPVRFRLGDVQQVDYLEGKFSGWRYGY